MELLYNIYVYKIIKLDRNNKSLHSLNDSENSSEINCTYYLRSFLKNAKFKDKLFVKVTNS